MDKRSFPHFRLLLFVGIFFFLVVAILIQVRWILKVILVALMAVARVVEHSSNSHRSFAFLLLRADQITDAFIGYQFYFYGA